MAYEEALKESSRSDVYGILVLSPTLLPCQFIFHILKKVNMFFAFNLLESIHKNINIGQKVRGEGEFFRLFMLLCIDELGHLQA